jgi:probable rRNA maturation factor
VYSSFQFFSEGISFQLAKKPLIRKWLNQVVRSEKKNAGTVNFIFCDDDFLLRLNKQYLKHNTFTDIITFPYEDIQKTVSGDIYISITRISENSTKFHQTFNQELSRVMVHGVLHLLGYHDKTKAEKTEMKAKEDQYLSYLS